jgi:penicillin-binding protein 1C
MKKMRRSLLIAILAVLLIVYFFSLPDPLFSSSYSTVLLDKRGHLLSAAIAPDGQWRFPEQQTVNEKFAIAITTYEDKRFWWHPGFDPMAIARAIRQNWKAGKIISGGSTLSMQVIRLSLNNPPRTIFQKMREVVLATRLELRYPKEKILSLYAAHAPFGGNVVGLEAACWRWMGRAPEALSWAEAALLAVLPNNPGLLHLARNREQLTVKRNALLKKLFDGGHFDAMSYHLALAEPIPESPLPLPRIAAHLLDRVIAEGKSGRRVQTSIDRELQLQAQDVVDQHVDQLNAIRVFNGAAIVVEVESGQVLAYVGNTRDPGHHEQVDVIRSPRSTGSILKPFLYAAMLEEGSMLPRTLQPDVPTLIGGYSPRNFSGQYEGAVAADQALIRSLNIPAVHELKEYRYEKFHHFLQQAGMTTLSKPADHYGLTLVLGGAEGTLWDITGMYASCTRVVNHYFDRPGAARYASTDIHPLTWKDSVWTQSSPESGTLLHASSWWLTLEALRELYRPGEETGWRHFQSSRKIAWKTGTSFGFRDGWAVGVTPKYVIGVWVGNAGGEGRPGLTGTEAASPLLFSLAGLLPGTGWFDEPNGELREVAICSLSGQRASSFCDHVDTVRVQQSGLGTLVCAYHKLIHVTRDKHFRVHDNCEPLSNVVSIPWFILPPIQEYYYRSRNLSYRPLPPYRKDCQDPAATPVMDLIYPKLNARIFIPKLMDGTNSEAVWEATHRQAGKTIYWHLDGRYTGMTKGMHRLSTSPVPGRHTLTLVDDSGETITRTFEVISH